MQLLTIIALALAVNGITLEDTICAATTEFFDISSITCGICGTNQEGDGTECICSAGYADTTGLHPQTCTDCTLASEASSRDRTRCVSCGHGTFPASVIQPTFDAGTRECLCPNTTTQILIEYDSAGMLLPGKACEECPAHGYPSPDKHSCVLCPDVNMRPSVGAGGWICTCMQPAYIQFGTQCIPQAQVSHYYTYCN